MGGSVAFAIKKNGKIQTREFGKNAIYAVCSLDFFQGKGEVMRLWGKEPNETFAPIEYGLIAVDFDSKWVGTIQDFGGIEKQLFYGTNSKNFRATAMALFKSRRLRGFQNDLHECEPVGDQDFDQWFDKLREHQKKTSSNSAFLDIAPPNGWVFEQYNNDASGWEKMIRRLAEREWMFDQAALSGWEEFMTEKEISPSVIAAVQSSVARDKLDLSTPLVSTPNHGRRF